MWSTRETSQDRASLITGTVPLYVSSLIRDTDWPHSVHIYIAAPGDGNQDHQQYPAPPPGLELVRDQAQDRAHQLTSLPSNHPGAHPQV